MSVRFDRLRDRYAARAERGGSFPDRVTFQRSTKTKGADGGIVKADPLDTSSDIPCRYKPSSAREISLVGKTIAGVAYTIYVPAIYSDELIDVDSECLAVIAEREDSEPERTFSVVAPLRYEGIEIAVLCQIQD